MWKRKALGEITSYMAKGIPPKYVNVETPDTIKVLNQKCNRNFQVSYKEARLHDNSAKKVPEDKMLRPGDILINSTGAGTAGRIAQIWNIPSPTTIDGHMILIRSTDEVDPLYFGYALKGYQSVIESFAEGSTGQTEINKTRLQNEIIISFPTDKNLQQKIGATLLNIDDKIKANEDINQNLTEQFMALYRQLMTSNLKLKKVELQALCFFQEGYVNPAQTHPEYFDGDVKWLRAVDINESFIIDTSRTITKAGFESAKKSALLFKPWTIVISKSGTVGRLGIIADYMCGNRAVINIEVKEKENLPFIYAYLKSRQHEFAEMAVGSVQKNLYVSLLEPLIVNIPENTDLTEFNNIGKAILNEIHNNCLENKRLSELRDSLLPKLMSGELDISNLNI